MRPKLSLRVVVVHSLLVLMVLVLAAACTSVDTQKSAIGEPVRVSEYIVAEDADMYLLTRARDSTAPVMLWLHGGPGGAQRPLFRYFNSDLENHFVVSYWDQRGAGRSFDPQADPANLTVDRHVADLDMVVDHLLEAFGQEQVILVGHSWGAALGLLYTRQAPEKVAALIAVNPLVSIPGADQRRYRFLQAQAQARDDRSTLDDLERLGPPPYDTAADRLATERLAAQYGAVFHQQPSFAWVTVRAVLSGLVTPWEIPTLIRANNLTLEAMHEELNELDLTQSLPAIDVPVAFFLGRHDHHVDAQLSADYLSTLEAPVKQRVWFEESAHNIPFEQPALFRDAVLDFTGSLAQCSHSALWQTASRQLPCNSSARTTCVAVSAGTCCHQHGSTGCRRPPRPLDNRPRRYCRTAF